MKKSIVTILIIGLLSVTLLTGYTYPVYNGLGNVYSESEVTIAPEVVYSEKLANNATNGIQRVYTVEADLLNSVVKPYVYSGEVTSKYNLSSAVNYAKQEGYQVVAAINGDLYDTSSGTPKGPVIHNGYLLTGGYSPEHVIAFGQNGAAYLSYASITYTMKYKRYNYTDAPVVDEQGNAGTEVTTQTTISDETANIDYFNVPHGGANGLHLYNRHNGATTRTTGSCVEVLLTVINGSVNLKIGETVTAKVDGVYTNSKNTAIGENQLVLSTKSGSATYSELWNMVPGSEVEITIGQTGGHTLDQATEAVGVYHVLANNGAVTTTDKTVNPRTCIGIKSDGSVILYVVDGRQTNSKGMNAVDVANYLVSKGCTAVVNMDGGGSTTMFARKTPGISDEASIVNTVSDGSMRNVANALLLVYSQQGTSAPAHLAVYPSTALLMPGASQKLETYAVNSLYESTSMPSSAAYTVSDGMGTVSDGVFTAGSNTGNAVITASASGVSGSTTLKIVDDFTYSISSTSLAVTPGQVVDLNVVNAKYGHANVIVADNLFTWECDSAIGTVDQNGVFTASSTAKGKSGYVTVKLNSQSVQVPVTVGSGFTDINNHWAQEYILDLADAGIIAGVTETTFEPNGSLTRAQVLVMLSKLAGADTSSYTSSAFTDVKSGDWYFAYVNWGVENKIVSGMGDGTFAPNAPVTREQMCVMMDQFANHIGLVLTGSDQELSFNDNDKMSTWALTSIKRMVDGQIMTGKPGNLFDPAGTATRGEAARIIYVVKGLYEGQKSQNQTQPEKTDNIEDLDLGI